MSMTTRLRSRKDGENVEPLKMQPGKTTILGKAKLTDAADKRKAFGFIENRIGSTTSLLDEKAKLAYKDVKPRVDTRWKKNEVQSRRTSKETVSVAVAPKPLPLLKQTLKSSSLQSTTSNIVRIVEVKHEVKSVILGNKKSTDIPLIHSPNPMRPKRENVAPKSSFESHSTHLLHQVDNIDEKDVGNPQMCADYVHDIYKYLYLLERVFPIRENFLQSQNDVTPKMRSVLLDWINEVHHQFSLETETYYMAVAMIDRYLQSDSNTSRKYLQLVGVTALFMASKYEELMPPEISDFVYVTDDTYTKEQILNMEMKIFQKLKFNLSKPLPIHFFRRFAKAAGSLGDRQYLAGKYFMELATVDYDMTKYHPSEVAAASLYLALHIFNSMKNDKDLWTPSLEYYSGYNSQHIFPIMKHLAGLVYGAKDSKNRAIFAKYSNAQFKFTSSFPEMSGAKIQELLKK